MATANADGQTRLLPAAAHLRANGGDFIRGWCLTELGITMFRSEVDIVGALRASIFKRELPDWHEGDTLVVSPFAKRATLSCKARVFLDVFIEVMT